MHADMKQVRHMGIWCKCFRNMHSSHGIYMHALCTHRSISITLCWWYWRNPIWSADWYGKWCKCTSHGYFKTFCWFLQICQHWTLWKNQKYAMKMCKYLHRERYAHTRQSALAVLGDSIWSADWYEANSAHTHLRRRRKYDCTFCPL